MAPSSPSAAPPLANASTKRVLVVGWSQSGQLRDVLQTVCGPLLEAGVTVDHWVLRPQVTYPFPWSFWQFLDAFPESVLQQGPALEAAPVLAERYDLIVLGHQVWYLSPSLPVTAFLQSAEAARLLAGTPVVVVTACRNMWINAFGRLQQRLVALGARVLDHVALTDTGPMLATFITTPRWMLTGRRDRFLGLPPAGVNAAETAATARFGRALADALAADGERGHQPLLCGLAATRVDPRLAFSEAAGARAFGVWARLVRLAGPAGHWRRRPLLALFVSYLILLILTVLPLGLVLQTLLTPLLARRNARIRALHEAPSGSGTERMARYV